MPDMMRAVAERIANALERIATTAEGVVHREHSKNADPTCPRCTAEKKTAGPEGLPPQGRPTNPPT